AGSAPCGVRGAAEAEAGHLEHVAQALGCDAHIVLCLRLAVERRWREGEHLVEPHLDDPGRVLAQRARRVELLDGTGLHAGTARAALISSSMLSRSAFRFSSETSGANPSFAFSCSPRSCSISDPIPRPSGAAISSSN